MSFDWIEYLRLAEELSHKTEESCLRSAISRAYYCAFCIARNIKGYKNYNLKKGENIHWKVINEYKSSHSHSEQVVGKFLDDLRRKRNEADYDEDKLVQRELTERMVLKAKEILKYLKIQS